MTMNECRNPLLRLCAGFILAIGNRVIQLSAQEATSVSRQPTLVKLLKMSPSNQTLSFPFWVDQTSSISITISCLTKDLAIQLVDPKGAVFVLGQSASNQFQSGLYPDPKTTPTAPGAHYFMDVECPSIGKWTLTIASPNSPAFTYFIPVRVNFNNSVGPVLFGGSGSIPIGRTVPFGLAVLDGNTKLSKLQISAAIFMLDDPTVIPVIIDFFDDGMGADVTAGDSIFGALEHPTQTGNYMLQVDVSGDASTGYFQRSISTGFKITAKTASISGNFTVKPRVGTPK